MYILWNSLDERVRLDGFLDERVRLDGFWMKGSDLTKRSVPVQGLAGLSRHACIFVQAGVPFTCAIGFVHAISGA